jgi:hypothetical protein
MKKPRCKKYHRRMVVGNPIAHLLGGLRRVEGEHLTKLNTKNHAAMHCIVHGHGTRELWDQLVGAINMANVMCELGTGSEYRAELMAGRDALATLCARWRKTGAWVLTGGEMQALNLALEVHDAQLEISRVIDVERAADEVVRRIHHNINTQQVAA